MTRSLPRPAHRSAITRPALALALVAAVASCGGQGTDPSIRRGRELLALGEADAAVRELRIALQRSPRSPEARALLLVALQRADDNLDDWYDAQIVFDRLAFLRGEGLTALEGFARVEKVVTGVRQELYDKGLDTRDADDLQRVTRDAAAYSFEDAREASDSERDHAAFALALHGDRDGLAHLVERLKSERASYVPELLARLPAQADAPLMAAAADPQSLARPRALDTLAQLRERAASEALFRSSATLRGVRPADLPLELRDAVDAGAALSAVGLTRDDAFYGIRLRDGASDDPPLRARWLDLTDDRSSRLLLLQGFDQESGQLVTRFHHFEEGRMTGLPLVAEAAVTDLLAREGPIVELARDGGVIHLVQIGKGAVPVQREHKRARYSPGDRVRVPGIGKDGTVRGTDEFGLLTIELDEPHRGLQRMSLTASAVRALETELVDTVGRRRYLARLGGGRLTVTWTGGELEPLGGGRAPTQTGRKP